MRVRGLDPFGVQLENRLDGCPDTVVSFPIRAMAAHRIVDTRHFFSLKRVFDGAFRLRHIFAKKAKRCATFGREVRLGSVARSATHDLGSNNGLR